MTHSIPFSLLGDGTWQLFNSHRAMLQCFRAEKKNPAASVSCGEHLGRENAIIHVGNGPGLELWGKRPSGPPHSSPPERWASSQPAAWDVSLLPADLGESPRRCFLHPSPVRPFPGSSTVSFPRTALAQPGRSDSVPRSSLAHTSLGLTYNQISVTAGGNSSVAAGAVLEFRNKDRTRKTVWMTVWMCTRAFTPTSVGENNKDSRLLNLICE